MGLPVIITYKLLQTAGMTFNQADYRLRHWCILGKVIKKFHGSYEIDSEMLSEFIQGTNADASMILAGDTGIKMEPDNALVKRLQSSNTKLIADRDNFTGYLVDNIMESLCGCTFNTLPEVTEVHSKGTVNVMLNFADWHYGKKFTTLLTKYDSDIFKDRIATVVHKMISEIDRYKDELKAIYINTLGDLVDGHDIFPQHAYEEEFDVATQTIGTVDVLVDIITKLYKRYNVPIYHYSASGNHGRASKNGNPKSNFDTISAHMVNRIAEPYLSGCEVFGTGFGYYSLDGLQIVLSHGTEHTRATFSQARTYISKIDSFGNITKGWIEGGADFVLYGHYHRSINTNLENCTIGTVGSLVGYDLYAQSKYMPMAYPEQSMYIITDEAYHYIPIRINQSQIRLPRK